MLRVANVAENLARSSAFLCIVAKEMVKNFRIKSFSKINHAFLLFFFFNGTQTKLLRYENISPCVLETKPVCSTV